MKEQIKSITGEYAARAIEHRRHIHMNPELSTQEYETQKYICEVLDKAGVPYRTYDGVCAVIARLHSDKPGKTIAFRADMDALHLQEENDIETTPYRSRNDGVMHACGHDGHVALLLTFAELMAAHQEFLTGDIVFIFQHSEENLPGGAKFLCDNGVLDDVDEVYGGHLWPTYEVGEVVYAPKEMMASADMFNIILHAPGGHGSQPHGAPDTVLAACQIVDQLQNIVSREVDACDTAVISVCQMHSGSAFNVIPDKAEIGGTVRTFSTDVQELIIRRMEEIVSMYAKLYGITYEFDYTRGYPPVVNHPEYVAKAKAYVEEMTDLTMVLTEPSMVGEDFSYYVQERPGSFFFIGCGNKAEGIECALHSSTFRMDERAMTNAIQAYLAIFIGSQKEE